MLITLSLRVRRAMEVVKAGLAACPVRDICRHMMRVGSMLPQQTDYGKVLDQCTQHCQSLLRRGLHPLQPPLP